MKITNLEFTWEENRQPQKYESVRASLTVSVVVEEGDDPGKVSEAIITRTKAKVKMALADEINHREDVALCLGLK